jgi:sulfate adenylyltransferase subunit 1 (EFTu-like GTPase family)
MMKMAQESLNIVIVGHVDHGKSTLIGRLFFDTDSLPPEKMAEIEQISKELGHDVEFAFLMDHLQEERDQGITIDTAQTFFKTDKRHYVIIDAPGHRAFLKNMITGASQAEAAVLVVDAEEGVREQTRRHAFLLSLLGLQQLLVIINKMDRVGFSEERYRGVCTELQSFLSDIHTTSVFLVPVSSKLGDNVAKRSGNMAWYRGPTVLEALDQFETLKPDAKPFRFPVQGIYASGDKQIVGGRVEAGSARAGQRVVALPENRELEIASLEKFLENPRTFEIGESGGFTFGRSQTPTRGQVLADPDHPPKAFTEFPATVFWMSRKPLQADETLVFRCTTQEVDCSIAAIMKRLNSSSLDVLEENATTLEDTEVGEMILRTEQPVVLEEHSSIPELGRFVLERGHDVVAGGIITTL